MIEAGASVRFELSPKQTFFLKDLSDVDSVLLGGAAGGGKSEALLAFALQRRMQYPGSYGICLRRTFPELEKSLIRKSYNWFGHFATPKDTGKTWQFDNGSIQEFGYCNNEADVYQYQSAEYDDICFDEASHFTEFQMVYMQSRLRPRSAPKGLIRLASNPGNVGHAYLKQAFVDPAREQIYTDQFGRTRYFLPAKLADNIMMTKEQRAEYSKWLATLPERERKQLEDGDWDYVPGAAFSEISRSVHSIDSANPPDRLLRVFDFERMTPKEGVKIYRGYDWGYASPAVCVWMFSDYENRLYIYRELYFGKGADEGLSMSTREQAQKIKQIEVEHSEKITIGIADASIWDRPTNQNEKAEKLPSNAEIMQSEGIYFDREISIAAKRSRLQRKHQLHERLKVDGDGKPGLSVFSTCVHWWRTVPVIPLDKLNLEDVDTEANDHEYDASTYVLAARPWKSTPDKPKLQPMSYQWLENRLDEQEKEQDAA